MEMVLPSSWNCQAVEYSGKPHTREVVVKVWCFKSGDQLWALTGESSGAQLPAHLGRWSLHKAVELSGDADDERQAIELIEAHGFCCFSGVPD